MMFSIGSLSSLLNACFNFFFLLNSLIVVRGAFLRFVFR